jgi:hypothetical protein
MGSSITPAQFISRHDEMQELADGGDITSLSEQAFECDRYTTSAHGTGTIPVEREALEIR